MKSNAELDKLKQKVESDNRTVNQRMNILVRQRDTALLEKATRHNALVIHGEH